MSNPGKSATPETNKPEEGIPELDVSKLHALPSEQQDLYLLIYVSDLRQYVTGLSAQALPAQQPAIKKEIIKIIGLSAPSVSRVVRLSLGRILSDIFTRGSRQLLHETINELLSFINAGKGEKDQANKHTATTCLGFTFQSAGDSAVSFHGLVVTSLIKTLKPSQNHTGYRASILRALGGIVEGLGRSIDEQVARDIWKQVRAIVAGDKSALVLKQACVCAQSLFEQTNYFNNSNDFEGLKTLTWKVLESTAFPARYAAARLLAHVLVAVYSDVSPADAVTIVRKPKKSNKKQGSLSDDEDKIDKHDAGPGSKAPTHLALNLDEILRTISSHYCKAATSNRARGGLAICYKIVFDSLPDRVVQDHYSRIADHLCNDLLGSLSITTNRYRLLLTRKYVQSLLANVIAAKHLTESAQVNAARWLINDILKNYPRVLQNRREPSKHCLAATLGALSHLLQTLGPAASAFQDSCREALFQVAQHPSYTVQVHVAACFRSFVHACPTQLVKSIEHALSLTQKELTGAEGTYPRRSLAYALAIAAMLRSARSSPLYGSLELFSKLFTFATELLKSSASSELRLCAMQVQVAWTVIGGLMTLGPNFTKVHLNQLLLLWRNALPPPLLQDNAGRRGHLELSFLAHVRETALAALLSFLTFNDSLLTSDGSRRIAVMLQNSSAFVDSLPTSQQTNDMASRLVPSLQLFDLATSLRRRVLQCFTRLLNLRHVDRAELISQTDLVGMTIRVFTSAEWPVQRNLEAALASSASSFEGIWQVGDCWGFGVNSLLDKFEVQLPSLTRAAKIGLRSDTYDPVEERMSRDASSPILQAPEYDSLRTYCNEPRTDDGAVFAPATSCLTSAMELFAIALPLQSPRIQESCLEQLATVMAQPLQREPGRKFTLQLNAITAVLCALAVANSETEFNPGKLSAETTSKLLAEIVRKGIIDQDATMRVIATQALGRLCNIAGNQFAGSEIKNLVDTIVANRDPHVRAGCALALGTIHSQVGAMAASYHLKNIIGVLLSLCTDPHAIVHYWALTGLAEVASSAGLSFSAYASSTLGVLAQLYNSDNHNEECGGLTASNSELDFSTPTIIADCVDSIINVLGPDLQDVTKARNLILSLVQFFQSEDEVALQVRSFVCLGDISLFAPAHVQLAKYVQSLQKILMSETQLLEAKAISGLENLIKRNAAEVILVASPGFGDELWLMLDKEPGQVAIQNILRTWLQQTYLTDTLEWVQQCQTILSRTRIQPSKPAPSTAGPKPKTAVPDLADEEVAGFAAAAAVAEADKPEADPEGQEFLRWQTRDFAMSLLSEMLELVQQAMLPDQIVPAEASLQTKVSDIVRIAFSASTATVVNLRIRGLHILDQILRIFGRTPDPDFLEASLLEQYQAQISSALTPAFAADSNAELAAEAIAVCSTFVATGIVTNADRMGRIFKVLSSGLENLAQDQPVNAVGDLKDLSSNAQSMLKMALLSGWAQLQLATSEQGYLDEIVQPYVPKLAPLWLASLQEFASLRFEPEISDSLGELTSANVHERYAAFDREVRLAFYQKSWLNVVDAIALLVEKDSNAVFDALDNKNTSVNGTVVSEEANGVPKGGKDMNFREEPVAFFFILFGLAYEALVTQARDNRSYALSILTALKRILTPQVSGHAVYQDAIFDETTETLDRLALTSSTDIQAVLVQIARNLSLDHIVAKSNNRDDKLSDDIDQLFELTRIIILVLSGLLPSLEDSKTNMTRSLSEEHINLIQMSFQALVDVSEVFPSVIKADLHACIIHIYCTILATGACQAEVVPRTMPILRSFLDSMSADTSGAQSNAHLVSGALHRFLAILSVAQRRENEHAIVCARNTLLSATILLTTAGGALTHVTSDPLVTRFTREILDSLQDVGLAKIAAGCVRSLLTTSPKTPADEAIGRILFPSVLLFVMDSSEEDPETVKTSLMQALVSSIASLDKATDNRAAAVSLLVPCLLVRARQPVPNGSKEDLSKDSAVRLLEVAASDPISFRATVAHLAVEQRLELENLLRNAGVGGKRPSAHGHRRTNSDDTNDDEENARPAIALRMDFD